MCELRIAAAYPYDANERGGVANRNWRRIAQWYLSVYARERLQRTDND